MGIFSKIFGKGKEAPKTQPDHQKGGSPETAPAMDAAAMDRLMTGQLVALYKQTHAKAYQEEYLRRLQKIGFTDPEANNLFLYESMTMKKGSQELLLRSDYIAAFYFNLKQPLLREPKEYYIQGQAFLCSEITKIWDEAEWHYQHSHEKDLTEPVWKEIFTISRYGGGELFMESLIAMSEKSHTPMEKIQAYAMSEQQLLFKYKWNPNGGERHPYR